MSEISESADRRMSLPAREVWIEISSSGAPLSVMSRHFPQGKCGLKFDGGRDLVGVGASLPAREVWIEM